MGAVEVIAAAIGDEFHCQAPGRAEVAGTSSSASRSWALPTATATELVTPCGRAPLLVGDVVPARRGRRRCLPCIASAGPGRVAHEIQLAPTATSALLVADSLSGGAGVMPAAEQVWFEP